MKRLVGIFTIAAFLMTSCASEIAFVDPCEKGKFGFITVTNGTMNASMDIYLDGNYVLTLPPQGQHFIDNVTLGEHEIEARESNGFRLWLKDIEVKHCEDTNTTLGE